MLGFIGNGIWFYGNWARPGGGSFIDFTFFWFTHGFILGSRLPLLVQFCWFSVPMCFVRIYVDFALG